MSEETHNEGVIDDTSVVDEMSTSFLSYAMSVIVSRALPDVRDGLKPVHRRIMYSMYDTGLRPDKSFVKCARIVGDCFVKGALVHTPEGLRPIEDLQLGDEVLSHEGKPVRIKQLYKNPPSALVNVKFHGGQVLTVTPGQLFLVVNEDYGTEWVAARDLGGKVVLGTGYSSTPVSASPGPSSAESYVLGVVVAEGYQRHRSRAADRRVSVSMVDEEPIGVIESWAKEAGYGVTRTVRVFKNKKFQDQHVVSVNRCEALLGATSLLSSYKRVPKSVLEDSNRWVAFLAGFLDGDGYVRKDRREIVLTTTSPALLTELRAMLAGLGIQASSWEKAGEKDHHGDLKGLTVSGANANRLAELVLPFVQIPYKQEALTRIVESASPYQFTLTETLPAEPLFAEFSRYHHGGGWFQDTNGTPFRASLDANGPEIRYTRGASAAKGFSIQRARKDGWIDKLHRVGSPMGGRLRDLEGFSFKTVASVVPTQSAETYDIQVDSEHHAFVVEGVVVHNCMGRFHPHGDSAIYEALVRMAQDFSMRVELVDGHGNFGTHADGAAAMRYCVRGDTLVRTPQGTVQIQDFVSGAERNSTTNIDSVVLGMRGEQVRASAFHHSGVHPTTVVTTREGYELACTTNHPLLVIESDDGTPRLAWKLVQDVREGDYVAILRGDPDSRTAVPSGEDYQVGTLLGGLTAEGWLTSHTVGFNNTDKDYFDAVLEAYDAVIGSPRRVRSSVLPSGKTLWTFETSPKYFTTSPVFRQMFAYSADKVVAPAVWEGSLELKRAYLASAFEGDGCITALPRNSVQLSYSTQSSQLARDIQQLLLEFGVVSSRYEHSSGEWKVCVTNQRDVSRFAQRVGFFGSKQHKLTTILERHKSKGKFHLSRDYVPFLGEYLRRSDNTVRGHRKWIAKHNVDRFERWDAYAEDILAAVTSQAGNVARALFESPYYFARVESVVDGGLHDVYSLRVDTDDHAFITNGFVSHNTEARMAPAAVALTGELGEHTVDMHDNYDGKTKEPSVLPARFPNLLVNGSTGIAVGMATNMAPHNLLEAVAACKHMIDNPDASSAELMEFIPAPDFPTGGILVGTDGAKDAYTTGKGQVIVRARTEFIDATARKRGILITELPYQVGPEKVMAKIKEAKDAKKLDAVTGVVDLSDRKHGLRMVVELRSGADEKKVLRELFRATPMQESFSIHNLALVDGIPKTLTLRELIGHYVNHRLEVTVRRSEYRRRKAQERAHLLEGYLLALASIDEVVATIRASKDSAAALKKLTATFDLSEVQAAAILEMPLRRLTSLEVNKIKSELSELQKTIKELTRILENDKVLRQLVKDELDETARELGTPRRTSIAGHEIVAAEAESEDDDSMDIADEPTVVWLSKTGMLGRAPAISGRAGKMDAMRAWLPTSTRSRLGVVTPDGLVHYIPVHELPDADASKTRGLPAKEMLELAVEPVGLIRDDKEVAIVTAQGLLKRVEAADLPKRSANNIITCKEGDEVVGVFNMDGEGGDFVMVTSEGQLLRTGLAGVNPKGAKAGGVAGMNTGQGTVIGAGLVYDGSEAVVATLTDGGSLKTTSVSEYPVKGRGGQGVRAHKMLRGDTKLVAAVIEQPGHIKATSASGALLDVSGCEGKRDGSGVKVDGAVSLTAVPPKK